MHPSPLISCKRILKSPTLPPPPNFPTPISLFTPTHLPFLSVSVVIGGRFLRLLGDEPIVADRLSVSASGREP